MSESNGVMCKRLICTSGHCAAMFSYMQVITLNIISNCFYVACLNGLLGQTLIIVRPLFCANASHINFSNKVSSCDRFSYVALSTRGLLIEGCLQGFYKEDICVCRKDDILSFPKITSPFE